MDPLEELKTKWAKWIIIGVVIGFLAGEVVSKIMGFFLSGVYWKLLIDSIVPLFVIIALLYVLYRYNKERHEILE